MIFPSLPNKITINEPEWTLIRGKIMEIEKEFELYRKLEVMAFRYFKMAEFLEICL